MKKSEKAPQKGSSCFYHQMLGSVIAHPDHKEVFPLCPEMIQKEDGTAKNDCERNAAKRWIGSFHKEHPHLKIIVSGDGLNSNAPLIKELKANDIKFIFVAKEADHNYLFDWLNAADEESAPIFTFTSRKPSPLKTVKKGRQGPTEITHTYQIMKEVPLNGSTDVTVTVVRFTETERFLKAETTVEQTSCWVWVTDVVVTQENVKHFVKGARARWKIENETFTTLKNQGYEFEHNYGHGYNNLSNNMAHLMMISFFIDQIIMALNKSFEQAVEKLVALKYVRERMRFLIMDVIFNAFDDIYVYLVRPPDPVVFTVD